MLPASAIAGVLILSLVPGWLFLRLTEKARRPRHQSDLQEVRELVAVGVLTTGLALTLIAIGRPSGVIDVELPPVEPQDLRELAWSIVGMFALACALAVVFGWIVTRLSPAPQASLATSVWWDILRAEKVPAGQLPYALVTLTDGSSVEGVLASYTWQSDSSHHRDIGLRAPIRYPTGDGKSRKPPHDFVIIAGADVKQLALTYVKR